MDERARVAVRLAKLEALWTQEPEAARRLLEGERDALRDVAPSAAAELTLAMATERNEYGDFAATLGCCRAGADAARAAGDRPLEALAAAMAADAANCLLRGDDPAAVAAADRQDRRGGRADRRAARRAGGRPPRHAADPVDHPAVQRRLPRRARRRRARARAGAETRQGLLTPAFVSVRGFLDQELGRLDSAEAHLEEALDSALLSGNVQVTYWASIESSVVALLRGRIEAALEHGQAAWELLGTREYSQAGFVVADARLAAGDPEGARAALEAFGWVRPQMWTLDRVKAAEIAVRVLLALGRVEEAAAWADRVPLESGGRRTGIFGALAARARAAVLLARSGARAAAARSPRPAPARRATPRCGPALPDARREALAAAAAGRRARASCGGRRASSTASAPSAREPRSGAAPARRPAAAAARPPTAATRRRSPDPARARGRRSWPRRTNAQIAHRLQLSERTVEKHVSNVLAKLGLGSRAGIVRLLAEDAPPS